MTNVEIGIIVIASLIPIVALVVFLPKVKRSKQSPKPKQAEPVQEVKVEEPAPVETPTIAGIKTASLDENDFLGYLTEKANRTTKPELKKPDFSADFDDDLFSDFDFDRPRKKKEEKSISDQIHDLSPEIKALILAGVLDRKDY